jgi:hypothetical protein
LDQDDFIAKVKAFLRLSSKVLATGEYRFCPLRGRMRKLVKALCVEKLSITLAHSEVA